MSSMQLAGQHELGCSCEQAWAALHSPQVLQQCVAGCESVEAVGADRFQLVMALAIGPVKARFKGSLTLVERQQPHETKLKFEGQGGVAGFGSGEAHVRIVEAAHGCTLHYQAQARAGGRLAQIGSRLIEATARQLSQDFFARLGAQLTVHDTMAPSPGLADEAPARSGLQRAVQWCAPYAKPISCALCVLLAVLMIMSLSHRS
jgi:uncharacterized protein